MKIQISFMLLCSFCFAGNYQILQVDGSLKTEYSINLGKTATVGSLIDSEEKIIELSPENKKFIEERLKAIEKMHGHEKRFCPRNYTQFVNHKKAKLIIACNSSNTEISKSIQQLIRVLNVYSLSL